MSIKYWLERDEEGRLCRRQPVDALWIDIPPLRHVSPAERTGYPTQKPRALLERIITSASPPGGLIVDLFAGSGTTGVAASGLGRRYIMGDGSPVALATMRSRVLRETGDSVTVQSCGPAPMSEAVEIMARALDYERIEVSLSVPSGSEPVAWALDTRAGTPLFRADWHAERGTGRRPHPLPLAAILPRASSVRARVYFVDGKVATASWAHATQPRPEPMSASEASA